MVLILMLGVFVAMMIPRLKNAEYTVVLTDKGFSPKNLTIQVGEKVTFKTDLGKEFWPASDVHPTHSIYSEFDPKIPLEPDASWSFVFTRSGTWRYHDHLDPLFTGTITVTQKDGLIAKPNCEGKELQRNEKQQCWELFVADAVGRGELSRAITYIKDAYLTDPFQIQPICHSLLHKVGEEAYKNYKKEGPLDLNTDLTLCAFGFFHGFTETVAKTSGDVKEISEFCTFVTKQLSNEIPNIETQCHHGIGHGSVDIDNQALWGDEVKMTERSKELCLATSNTGEQLMSCSTGMYDAISIAYFSNQYKLQMNMDDPFWLCRIQEEDVLQEACYVSLIAAVSYNLDYDLKKIGGYIKTIPEEDVTGVTNSLANTEVNLVGVKGKEYAEKILNYYKRDGVEDCRSLPINLVQNCISSVASALAYDEVKEPNYLEALDFCNQGSLSETEKDWCINAALSMLKNHRSIAEFKEICSTFKGRESEICKRILPST